ncbi:MAG: branched-chain amino acid ABC transporter permease [Gammaproteobacteria bacterium]|nr:branched-chain amino acid ABC transporter permease [Gammaproteobacteria bacterium]NIR85279.1 branched-chain amino acid ABC transporter permease [Gammaproteobacteria bacterium]NIR88395.1 branched-chain amino acid ABC transporter permease [Gammaproteobacteria bacterium]NIU06345.1 branched-chain amino acid ABC transporter permease [Gammaproteobacteria bacterium]NIV53244.1 branched-chain amino acid ABC transporter permease [Gammaproteobacteria bacterium]
MIDFLVYLLTIVAIWGILSLSLNVQYGLTGLVNLGHVAFFMLGAYISTILVMMAGLPIGVGWLGGIAAAALFGVLMALPTANLQQDYWAISTLAAAEIVRLIFLNEELQGPYVGASFGVGGIPRPLRDLFTTQAYGYFYLALALACLFTTYLLARWVTRTPFGRALKALREGDEVPLALGKNARSLRIRGMALGGAMGGLAGALFAHYNAFIQPNYFLPLETFLVWAMVILGGAGNHLGALLGTVVVQTIINSTRFVDDFVPIDASILGSMRMIVVGVLIILVIIYLPNGVLAEKPPRYERRGPAQR